MFCRFCGRQLNDNAVFCNICGNRLKNGKANAVDYSTLSLSEEIKKSKLLCFVPLFYLLWNFLRVYLLKNSVVSTNITYTEIVSIVTCVVHSFFLGVLSYAAIKRSSKFSLIFMIPYFIYDVGYPFIFSSFQIITVSDYSLVNYIGAIIIPFVVFCILRIIKTLMKNIKSRWPVGIVSVIATMLMFAIYIVFINWMSYARWLSQVDWESYAEQSMRFQLPIALLLLYGAGIMVSNIMMHIVYKSR